MSDDLRVNGNLIAWGSHILKINGNRWFGITGISWDQKRERAYGWGMARSHAPSGRTPGKYTPGALKTTLWKHTAGALRAYLASLVEDGRSYGNAEVPIFLQYVEGSKTFTYEFEEATTVGENCSDEENADPNKEEWEWSLMRIRSDGLTLYDSSEEGA
jgi:hypothetical protein